MKHNMGKINKQTIGRYLWCLKLIIDQQLGLLKIDTINQTQLTRAKDVKMHQVRKNQKINKQKMPQNTSYQENTR